MVPSAPSHAPHLLPRNPISHTAYWYAGLLHGLPGCLPALAAYLLFVHTDEDL